MENSNYANAYKEVLIIINNLVKEDYEKIPKEYIDFLKANCNEDHDFKYDNSKPFAEQNLLEDTKYILFALFERFGATETQKEKIKSYITYYDRNHEEQKKKKYEIIKDKQNYFNLQNQNIQEKTQIIKYTNKKWYQKLISKILKIFRKN